MDDDFKVWGGLVVTGLLAIGVFVLISLLVQDCHRTNSRLKSECSFKGGEVLERGDGWYCRYPHKAEQ